MTDEKKTSVFPLLGVFLVVTLVFSNSFFNGFVNWDDAGAIVTNEAIQDLSPGGVARLFEKPIFFAYVPLYFLSLSIDYGFFGLDPFGFHLSNLLFHLMNVMLVFLLVRRLSGSTSVAALSACLFGVHPVQVECVTWMSGRKDVLATFLLLAGVFSFEIALCTAPSRARTIRFGASLILVFLATMAKATSLVFPGLFVLWQLACRRQVRKNAGFGFHGLSFLLGLGGVALHYGVALKQGVVADRSGGMEATIARALDAFSSQCVTLAAPFSLSPTYPDPGALTFTSINFMIGAGLVLFLLTLCLSGLFSRKTGGGFAAGLILVSYLPYNTIFPATDVMRADRYLYLATAGFGTGVALLLFSGMRPQNPRRRKALIGTAALLVCGLGFLTWKRNFDWRSSLSLWETSVAQQPREAFPRIKLGESYLEKAMTELRKADREMLLQAAATELRNALSLLPTSVQEIQARSRLGRVYLLLGDNDQAAKVMGDVIELVGEGSGELNGKSPEELARFRSDALLNRSQALLANGEQEDAMKLLLLAIEANPESSPAHYNLGNLLCRKALLDGVEEGMPGADLLAKGRTHLTRAAELDPASSLPLLVLGEVAYLLSRRVEAVNWFEEAIVRDPSSVQAHIQLSKVYLGASDPESALREADLAVQHERKASYQARLNRAHILAAVGRAKESRDQLESLLVQRPDAEPIKAELTRLALAEARAGLSQLAQGRIPTSEGRVRVQDAVLSASTRAAGLSPESVDAFLLQGEIHKLRRKWPEAQEAYDRALSLAPDHPGVKDAAGNFYKDLGYFYFLASRKTRVESPEKGKEEEEVGIGFFEKAIELRPGAPEFSAIRNLVSRFHERELDEVESEMEGKSDREDGP